MIYKFLPFEPFDEDDIDLKAEDIHDDDKATDVDDKATDVVHEPPLKEFLGLF